LEKRGGGGYVDVMQLLVAHLASECTQMSPTLVRHPKRAAANRLGSLWAKTWHSAKKLWIRGGHSEGSFSSFGLYTTRLETFVWSMLASPTNFPFRKVGSGSHQ
jgi:hypothetical protein